MIKFLKQLFCIHNYEPIKTFGATIYTQITDNIPFQCEKCDKIKIINFNIWR